MTGLHYRLGAAVIASVLCVGAVALADAREAARHAMSRDPASLDGLLNIARQDCPVTGSLADGNAERGATIYAKKCAKCHGVDGDGKGKGAKALEKKPKPWNTKEAWEKTTDKVKFQATKCGGEAVKLSDDMPDYKELSDQQIWDVLAYAKTFQSPEK